ncbi:ABC transporter permease [Candidatus Venteria ishoeyi]|uniref:ABC-2 type transporter n=1 Tax=Candidatus Venteria ishoeyi TaxID=1899563 RepID=A0A1H6F5V4_9GAMM|nr:ABC transporter permease [Candidatus Venteria ishoeyi]SEH04456.1 ABC-2 type transporter [Candidatus Venteria ishoeyi]
MQSFKSIAPTRSSLMSHMMQITYLSHRRLLAFYRDKNDVAVTFLQAPLLAVIFFIVFQEVLTPYPTDLFQPLGKYATANILIFIAVLSAVWFGASKAIVEIPAHLVLYRQEHLSFLSPLHFITAHFIALALIALVQIILFSLSFHTLFVAIPAFISPESALLSTDSPWHMRLAPGFWLKFTVLLWLTALLSITTAMLISIFVKTRAAATAVLTFLMIVQLLLGGSLIQPVKKMNTPVRTAALLTASRWGFEAAIIEFEQSLRLAMPLYQLNPDAVSFSFAQAAGKDESLFQSRVSMEVESVLQQLSAIEVENLRSLLEAEPRLQWQACICKAINRLEEPLSSQEQTLAEACYAKTVFQPDTALSSRHQSLAQKRHCIYEKMTEEDLREVLKSTANHILSLLERDGDVSGLERQLLNKMLVVDPKIALYRQFHRQTVYGMLAFLTLLGLLFTWLMFRWREA